ncbi:hypothetical protein [uncultured Ruegeria sp.]|nr:hypothetical protein [uncultured Ruegeria sp.]
MTRKETLKMAMLAALIVVGTLAQTDRYGAQAAEPVQAPEFCETDQLQP